MNNTIHIENLSKVYKQRKTATTALNNITLELPSNKIIGLIGPNGAGKSTLLKIIANQIFPSDGSLSIGNNTTSNSNIHTVCLVKDSEDYFTPLKVKVLFDIAEMHYPNWDSAFALKLIKTFKIDLKKQYGRLSKGQRGLINIVIAFASKATITIFDETHISLDAVMRQHFFDLLIEEYTLTERTFILSTHYINEASNLFEDIVILSEGEILLHSSKDAIDEQALTLTGPYEIGAQLLTKEHLLKVNRLGNTGEFHYFGPLSDQIKDALKGHHFSINHMPLESLFLNLIHKETDKCIALNAL